MGSIGAAEVVLILLIAFIVVGPKDLPKIARALARTYKRIRAMIDQLKEETGLDELSAELKDIQRDVKQTGENMRITKEVQETALEVNKEIKGIKKELSFKDFKNQIGGK